MSEAIRQLQHNHRSEQSDMHALRRSGVDIGEGSALDIKAVEGIFFA